MIFKKKPNTLNDAIERAEAVAVELETTVETFLNEGVSRQTIESRITAAAHARGFAEGLKATKNHLKP